MIYIDSPRLANKKMIFHSYVHLPAEATAPHFVSEIQTIPWSPFDARVARAESGVPTAASERSGGIFHKESWGQWLLVMNHIRS